MGKGFASKEQRIGFFSTHRGPRTPRVPAWQKRQDEKLRSVGFKLNNPTEEERVPANAPARDGKVHEVTGRILWDEPGKIPKDLKRFEEIKLDNPLGGARTFGSINDQAGSGAVVIGHPTPPSPIGPVATGLGTPTASSVENAIANVLGIGKAASSASSGVKSNAAVALGAKQAHEAEGGGAPKGTNR